MSKIEFIWDKRSGRHKGCAYIELEKLKDLPYALKCDGKIPDFQRFPIKVQASDSGATIIAMGIPKDKDSSGPKAVGSGGFRVYVSNVVCGVNEHHMRNIFGLLGTVTAVQMQNTDWSKGAGFAFVQYKNANEGQLAVDGMDDTLIGGTNIKTCWAKLTQEFGESEAAKMGMPANATERVSKARQYAGLVVPDLPGR